MSDLDSLLGGGSSDDLLLSSEKAETKSDGGSTTGLKVGIVIAVIIALAGVAIAAASLALLDEAKKSIKTNADAIATNTSSISTLKTDVSDFKPVAALYDSSTKTLTVENLNVETINFTHGGTTEVGAISLTAIPGEFHVVSNIKDTGNRVIGMVKYQPGEDKGSFYAAGGFGPNLKTLKDHTCKPLSFC